jgi:copper chaperone CopZ
MTHDEQRRFNYTLPDMTCGSCLGSVRVHLENTFPHGRFALDLRGRRLTADLPASDRQALEAALDEIGYPGQPMSEAGVKP